MDAHAYLWLYLDVHLRPFLRGQEPGGYGVSQKMKIVSGQVSASPQSLGQSRKRFPLLLRKSDERMCQAPETSMHKVRLLVGLLVASEASTIAVRALPKAQMRTQRTTHVALASRWL